MNKIPSAAAYRQALRQMGLAKAMPDTYWRLLRRHFAAPAHTLTTMELAHAMDWTTHSPVNAHYGTFGDKLAKRMGWAPPAGEAAASSVASFEGGGPDDPHTKWIMRPELAAALEALKIVPLPEPPKPA